MCRITAVSRQIDRLVQNRTPTVFFVYLLMALGLGTKALRYDDPP